MTRTLYTLQDFFRSKNGMVFLGTSLLFVAILWISAPSGGNPNLTIDSSESSDADSHSGPALKPDPTIPQIDKNDSFELFAPAKPQTRHEIEPYPSTVKHTSPPPRLPPSPQPIAIPTVHEPLIKEEHLPAPPAPTPGRVQAPTLPVLEAGATIHCQLLTPATTDQGNTPITAIVTRPLFRNGVLIIPRGATISGKIQSSTPERVFFAPSWNLVDAAGEPLSVSGFARQKSNDASDGRLGLPGFQEAQRPAEHAGRTAAGTLVRGAAELGKDTVRTNVGEFVPATGRNAVLSATSAIVDQLLGKPSRESTPPKPRLITPAGTEFLLTVSATESPGEIKQGDASSIDALLEQTLRQRLNR